MLTETAQTTTERWKVEASQGDKEACDFRYEAAYEDIVCLLPTGPEDPEELLGTPPKTIRAALMALVDLFDESDPALLALIPEQDRGTIATALDSVSGCLLGSCECGYEHVDAMLEHAQALLDELCEQYPDSTWWQNEAGLEQQQISDIHLLLHKLHRGRGFSWFAVRCAADGTLRVECEGGGMTLSCACGQVRSDLLAELQAFNCDETLVDIVVHLDDAAAQIASSLVLQALDEDAEQHIPGLIRSVEALTCPQT